MYGITPKKTKLSFEYMIKKNMKHFFEPSP